MPRRTTPAVFARKGHKELVAAFAARRPHEALLEVAAPAEALELGLHELRQRTLPAFLEAREEAREVPTHEHRRVAVVGLARDVGARPCACGHGAGTPLRLAVTRPTGGPPRVRGAGQRPGQRQEGRQQRPSCRVEADPPDHLRHRCQPQRAEHQQQLYTYALGRERVPDDLPYLDEIDAALPEEGGTLTSLIELVTISPAFRMRPKKVE